MNSKMIQGNKLAITYPTKEGIVGKVFTQLETQKIRRTIENG